jgi:hypothetical protein
LYIEGIFARIRWIRPSDADPDLVIFERPAATAWDQPAEPISVQGAGAARGIVLHKIMEELITGEVEANVSAIRERLTLLVQQLYGVAAPEPALDANELAETALRTWSLPELVLNRAGLIAGRIDPRVVGCVRCDRVLPWPQTHFVRAKGGSRRLVYRPILEIRRFWTEKTTQEHEGHPPSRLALGRSSTFAIWVPTMVAPPI